MSGLVENRRTPSSPKQFPRPLLLPFVIFALFAVFVSPVVSQTSFAPPTTNVPAASASSRCGHDVTPYLVAKILQLRGIGKKNVTLESLDKLLPLFEESVEGEGNFTAVRACADANADDGDTAAVAVNLTVCLKHACLGASFVGDDADVVYSIFAESLENRCYSREWKEDEEEDKERVPWQKSVGYGTAFAAIVVAGSQFGGLLYPFRKHIVYKIVLTYLIGLACGTLAGGGVLHLMPASLDMQERQPDHAYVYRAAMILGGAYLFYWVERILRDVSKWNKTRKSHERKVKRMEAVRESRNKLLKNVGKTGSIAEEEAGGSAPGVEGEENMREWPRKVSIDNKISTGGHNNATAPTTLVVENNDKAGEQSALLTSEDLLKDVLESNLRNNNDAKFVVEKRERLPSHSSRSQIQDDTQHKEGEVAPIAWILIMAKIFSTFIDGLSMGAAFTDTIPMGIKIGIAIICEEYPHELGDIAVLLNSGMNFKRALLWNFIAASAVFPGVYVGILAGGTSDANPWIFAIAAGMFVYIALVDMIPELNKLGDELSLAGVHYVIVTIIQHLGLFSGFMLMFSMAVWGDEIGE